MSLDTAAKRLAAIDFGLPWRGASALPDGAINAADRVALIDLYGGNGFGTAYTLTALTGSFSWAGYDADFTTTTHINSSQKRLALMDFGLPWRGDALLPTGSIGPSGRSILLDLYVVPVTVNNYTITCETGAFAWVGEPSFSDFEITCVSGVFTITGSDATLIATRTLFATAGVYAWTGYDANLIKFTGRTMIATSGVFAWTGSDANITRPRYMYAESGSYSYTGYTADLTWYDAQGQPVRPGHGGGVPGHKPHPPHPHPHKLTMLQIHSEEDMMMLLATVCAAGMFNRKDD